MSDIVVKGRPFYRVDPTLAKILEQLFPGRVAHLTVEGAPFKLCLGGDFGSANQRSLVYPIDLLSVLSVKRIWETVRILRRISAFAVKALKIFFDQQRRAAAVGVLKRQRDLVGVGPILRHSER